MPEARVVVRWPDDVEEVLWSPSLVVHDHLEAGAGYPLEDFVGRAVAAMTEADRRVRERYGTGCAGAAATAEGVRRRAADLHGAAVDAVVQVLSVEPPMPAEESARSARGTP